MIELFDDDKQLNQFPGSDPMQPMGSGVDPASTSMHLYVDMASVIRAHSDAMLNAFQMGRQAREDADRRYVLGGGGSPVEDAMPFAKRYRGVYDDAAYGVYDNPASFSKAMKFWHRDSLHYDEFDDYDAALSYAQQGIAAFRNMQPSDLPSMLYHINWREIVK